jgi:hypothetical protein
MNQPAIFGERVISTGDYESHPAFAPEGHRLCNRQMQAVADISVSLSVAGDCPPSELAQDNAQQSRVASVEANKAVVRRFFEEIQNRKKAELIPEIFSPRAVINGRRINMEAMARNLKRADSPIDGHITINEMGA